MAINGQSIILPGVAAAAASGARNDMTQGDSAAAMIPDLMTCLMAESVRITPAGFEGFDATDSRLLITSGVNAGLIAVNQQDPIFAGRPSITMPNASGLDMPAGSAGGIQSYTAVLVMAHAAEGLAGGENRILTIVNPNGDTVALTIRRFGAQLSAPGLYIQPYSATGNDRLSILESTGTLPVADSTVVYVVDWSNSAKLLRLGVNSSVATAQTALPNSFAAATDANARWRLGPSIAGPAIGRIARLYVWPRSLMSSTIGTQQLTDLVAALKSTYGIA